MKKLFVFLFLIAGLAGYSQITPSYPNIQLTKLAQGTKHDSLVVIASDKKLKQLPVSEIVGDVLHQTGDEIKSGNLTLTDDLGVSGTLYGSGAAFSSFVQAIGFKVPSGVSSQFLKADGSVDSASYIQNQNSSAQSANMWISGVGSFNQGTNTNNNDQSNARNRIQNTSGQRWDLIAGVHNYSQSGFSIYNYSDNITALSFTNLGAATFASNVISNASFYVKRPDNALMGVAYAESNDSLILGGTNQTVTNIAAGDHKIASFFESGKVGINTTAPTGMLTVKGNGADGWINLETTGGNPTIYSAAGLNFHAAGNNSLFLANGGITVGSGYANATIPPFNGASIEGQLLVGTNTSISGDNFQVNGSGYFDTGVTSWSSKTTFLEVSDTSRFYDTSSPSDYGEFYYGGGMFYIASTGGIMADSFKTYAGTSSQFLKADGSVDSTAYAPLSSPTFTGTPVAPTATAGTNTTQVATTAFVQNAVSSISSTYGTYTPTFTAGTNTTAFSNIDTFYTVIGKVVTIYFRCNVTQTTANVASDFRISLPTAYATLSSSTAVCHGTAFTPTGPTEESLIGHNVSGGSIAIYFKIANNTAVTTAGTISYTIP